MRKMSEFKVSTGITSILMIFVVLCLTAFGVLSYSAANADLQLSEKNAQNIRNYYEAENRIMENVRYLDGVMYEAGYDGLSGDAYYEAVGAAADERLGDGSYDKASCSITIREKLNTKQALCAVIRINDGMSDIRYTLESMKVCTGQ